MLLLLLQCLESVAYEVALMAVSTEVKKGCEWVCNHLC